MNINLIPVARIADFLSLNNKNIIYNANSLNIKLYRKNNKKYIEQKRALFLIKYIIFYII